MARKIIIHCFTCGDMPLSEEQYRLQLWQENTLWYCPVCGKSAAFKGVFHQCIAGGCDGWASEDTDACDQCGEYQQELYYSQQESEE
jgi:hypothetical protein